MFSINSVTMHFFHLDNVLRTVLALFMEDEALPLPSLEEVLICNPNTTAEEVRESSHTCAEQNSLHNCVLHVCTRLHVHIHIINVYYSSIIDP